MVTWRRRLCCRYPSALTLAAVPVAHGTPRKEKTSGVQKVSTSVVRGRTRSNSDGETRGSHALPDRWLHHRLISLFANGAKRLSASRRRGLCCVQNCNRGAVSISGLCASLYAVGKICAFGHIWATSCASGSSAREGQPKFDICDFSYQF